LDGTKNFGPGEWKKIETRSITTPCFEEEKKLFFLREKGCETH